MEGYLGEFPVVIEESKFKDWTKLEWALFFIEHYGQYDGGHHKQWVMDQVVRILKGGEVVVVEARWENGTKNFRYKEVEATEHYNQWVKDMKDGEDGPNTYSYDEGCPP